MNRNFIKWIVLFLVIAISVAIILISVISNEFNTYTLRSGLDDTSHFLSGNIYENSQYGFKLTYPASSTFDWNHPGIGFIVRFIIPNGQRISGDIENVAIYVEQNSLDLNSVIARDKENYTKNGQINLKEVTFGGQKAYREIFTSNYTASKGTRELFYYTVKDGVLYGLNYYPVVDKDIPVVDKIASSFEFIK